MLPLMVAYSHSQALDMGIVPVTFGDLLDIVMADFGDTREDIQWMYTPPDAPQDALQGPLGMRHVPFTVWTETRVYGSYTYTDDADGATEQFVISAPRSFEVPQEFDGVVFAIVNKLSSEDHRC